MTFKRTVTKLGYFSCIFLSHSCPVKNNFCMLPSLYIQQSLNHESILSESFKNIFAKTWMDLETVIQSDLNQKEKNKYYILMHICGI